MPLAPSNSVPTANWLSDSLLAARLFDPLQLSPYLSEFQATGSLDGTDLANFLVETGLLSRYQADRAIAGDASKLNLGPYILVEPIGSGSLGTVYQALGRSDRKRYAVKVLPLRSLWNVQQAKQQVHVFENLPSHPAVVPFVDVDTSGGCHYLAWPFVLGKTLSEIVSNHGPRPTDQTVRIASQIAEGLLLCHTYGVSHGLLKPSNLLIGNDNQARILDLGIGAILSENLADNESMLDTISTANAAISMLDYAAPETLNNPTLRTPAGDIYSLGCTLYYMLTGGMPFPEGNAVDKVLAHQTCPPRAIRKINPTVPKWLEALTLRMMAKDEIDRPPTADVLAALLSNNYAVPNPEDSAYLPQPEPANASNTPWLIQPVPRIPEPLPQSDTPVDHGTIPLLSELSSSNTELTDPRGGSESEILPPPPAFGKPFRLGSTDELDASSKPDLPAPVTYSSSRDSVNLNEAVTAVETPKPPASSRSLVHRLMKMLAFWKSPTDTVQLSVFGPRTISPGENVSLQVFAHLPEAFPSVRTLSKVFHKNGELLATGYLSKEVHLNQKLGLHLGVVNAGIDRSEAELIWRGQPQPRKFDLHVPWESPAGPSPTVLSAGLDRVLAGRIEFTLQILPRKA